MKLELEEVEKFEKYFQNYEESVVGKHLKHISLNELSRLLKEEENAGRVFTAYLDIKLSFSHVFRDIQNIRKTWNDNFSKGKLEGGSVLDSQQKFDKKMDMHYYFSSFVLRYRAIWDKVMGFILLIMVEDEEYKNFEKAKSRKKAFKKSAETSGIPKEFYEEIFEKLTDFDNKFRTAEAHGTGSLRKFVFEMTSMADNSQEELLLYWNFLNETVDKVAKTILAQIDTNLQSKR